MIWKKRRSNLIVVSILSIIFTVVSFLLCIGPLHMNSTGAINQTGILTVYSIFYWLVSLAICWSLYFYLRHKPEILFFSLVFVGIALIIMEVFLWGWIGP